MAIRDFRKITAWQRAHRLTLDLYRESQVFPRMEEFGLTSQLRRAAAAIPANIAEGAGRPTAADYSRFLGIALGSCNETESHLLLASDLGYLDLGTAVRLRGEVAAIRAMLVTLRKRLVANL